MKKYTVISTLEDPRNITSLLAKRDIEHVQAGEDFIMYPAIVIVNKDDDPFPQFQTLASSRPDLFDTDRLDSNWLSPFRNYCFQVSATITGQYNMGECPVVGLGNIICADYQAESSSAMPRGAFSSNVRLSEMYQPLLTALAKEALFEYALRLNRGNPRRNLFDYNAAKLMNSFIDLVVARLRGARLVPEDPTLMGIVEESRLHITEVDDLDEFLKQQGAELIKLMPAVEDPA